MRAFCAASQIVWPSAISTVTDSISNETLGMRHLQSQPIAAQQPIFDFLDEQDQLEPLELALDVFLERQRAVHQVARHEMRRLLLQLVGEERPVLGAAAEVVDELVLAEHLFPRQLAGYPVGF